MPYKSGISRFEILLEYRLSLQLEWKILFVSFYSMYRRSQFRSVKMFRPFRGKSEKVFLHEYTDSDERRFERCVTECSHRIACSRRRFECRRCRGATCTQGLTGLRGPLAMPSRSHEAGDLVLNFFLLNIDRDRARLIHSRPVIIHAARFSFLHSSSSNLKFSTRLASR